LSTWLSYLKDAEKEPFGLALICSSPKNADKAKRQLYLARATARKAGDKTLDSMSISMSPHSDDILFIYHNKDNSVKEAENAQSPGPGNGSSNS